MSHNPPPTGLSMHNLAAEVTLTELVNMNHSFALSFPDCQAFGAMSGIQMFGSFVDHIGCSQVGAVRKQKIIEKVERMRISNLPNKYLSGGCCLDYYY